MSKQANKSPEDKVDGYLHAALVSLNIALRLTSKPKRQVAIKAAIARVEDLRG